MTEPNTSIDALDTWFILGPEGDLGPVSKSQLVELIESGAIAPDALVRNGYSNQQWLAGAFIASAFAAAEAEPTDELAARPLGDFVPNAVFDAETVEFQNFLGADPVLRGKGTAGVANGVLSLRGRGRRLFALRKRDEHIPLEQVQDVAVSGRVLRFTVADSGLRQPRQLRLLRLGSPNSAARLALCLPDSASESGQQVRADTQSYAMFLEARGPAFATLAIMAINFFVFVVCGFSGVGWLKGNAALLLDFGGNFAVATTGGEWWRLVSSMFLHSGLIHVGFNMWALWEAGRVAERLFGSGRYVALYLLAGLLGSIASINWQQDLVGVGASGAVFGVIGGLLAALLLRPDLLPGTITRKLQTSATLFIAYSLFNGFTHTGIDNAAHVGGLVAGALIGTAYVMPMGRALAATAVTLMLIGGGTVRAVVVAEPYGDELAFRQFLSSYPKAEARLNDIALSLQTRANTLSPQELLRVLEHEMIPGWVEQDTRIAALPRVTPRSRSLRDNLASFVHLRRESWELLSDGVRRNDASGVEAFKRKSAEANVAMEGIKAWIEQANKDKGKQR
ncbi:MAG: rhomboid family intramembrane serine protease [Sulfuritalea sp.]|nr:rhomboid family intramembrane serine protease [Sulfuritalea sp.]